MRLWEDQVKVLGVVFSGKGKRIDLAKIQAISTFPALDRGVVVDGDHLWPLLHRPLDLAEAALLVQAQTCRTSPSP